MLKQNIFRAYDIRGIYPDELNAETANLIGKGFATYIYKKTKNAKPNVVVGRDCRIHSEELQKAFIEGLVSSGCNVTDIGLAASPYLYFVDTYGKFDGACNITASHNPKEYNGFKLMLKDAHAVFGNELQKIYQILLNENLISGKGKLQKKDFTDEYFKKLKSIFSYSKPLKVVIDTGNGVTGAFYPPMIKKLGHEVIGLFSELDGNFPNHEPDPIVETNLVALKKKALETKADIGIAFDGDGDRLSLVTEKGEFINADKTLMLLAVDALTRNPNRAVVFTVSNSQVLFDLIKEWGGNPVMCKVGHSYVEDAMHTNNAIVGGEQSGHYFLPENYFSYDDALVTACRILKILDNSNESASAIFDKFPKTYSMPEMRPECGDFVKFDIIQRITKFFKNKYPANMMDGVRLDFGNGGWAGIRASNTSPRISITMEAKSKEELEHIKTIILGHLKTYPEIKWDHDSLD